MRNVAGIPGAKRVQRLSLIAAIGIGALAFTGCSAINPQSTTMQVSPSDGVKLDMGSLKLRNVLIISSGVDAPGRLLGTFYNDSTTDITLTISGAQGSQTEVTVKAGGNPVVLNGKGDKAILSTIASPPGALETLNLRQSGGGTETGTLNVPVLDGTLAEYKTLVPTPAPTQSILPIDVSTPTSSATPTP